ncbi:MAG: acetyl-CoA carboxylase biotin carboxyl carrier protein subunit [Bacteroidales bacterium]
MKKFKFTIRGHEYDVEVKNFEDRQALIEVNGTSYEVELHKEVKETKTPKLVRKPIETPKDAHEIKKEDKPAFKVKAPLPGTIMQVFVRVGDEVKKGDRLLIYEAMKMENNVMSEKEGTIRSVKVTPGDNVLQDDVLIEIAN